MFSGLSIVNNVSFVLVFFEGVLSFFSPCVIPLIPVYISYLAGNGKIINEDGTIFYKRKKVLTNTLFFIAGISSTFFILGLSFSALGTFFINNKTLFSQIGGIIIIVLGLSQVGLLKLNFLKNEKKFNLELTDKMNPIIAFIMGFTFSFAWTPCVGPALSSVLILASGASHPLKGNLLVLVYAIGFVLPFLALGLFTTQTLNFFKENRNLMKYTVKIGGAILIIIGILTFTGQFNDLTKLLSF
ncbi:cytochrome c-type biogenesis protein [Sedimentibacter acidaminivorans]|uniref:Cytochrome c-type biogenesis protein n=1 Tax=Sedimentibacter acidaminivorans TaxID=913099 RepID=A0ABS4GF56_9FIRM|nr:cytochrome c biogenesis CcdA family protein [Sedimentibacter acidaminivorans]MBP1926323.1 cytochrome c-type biogenesis protein [Sedimentibacter acidaminivorans]